MSVSPMYTTLSYVFIVLSIEFASLSKKPDIFSD